MPYATRRFIWGSNLTEMKGPRLDKEGFQIFINRMLCEWRCATLYSRVSVNGDRYMKL